MVKDRHMYSRGGRVGRRDVLMGSAAIAAAATFSTLVAQSRSGDGDTSSGRWPGTPAGLPGRQPRRRPNILLIVTDDEPKGTEWATSKTRDWLVAGGVELTNAHATTPLCGPSRASIFSGRYAHNHGVRDNSHPYNLDQNTTVQRHLAEAGYRTGMFGKYMNVWDVGDNPPHFEEWLMLKSTNPPYDDAPYNDNGAVTNIPGYSTQVITERTLAFLDKATADPRPWFAYVAPFAPHTPYVPEARYAYAPVPEWEGRPSVHEFDTNDKPPWVQRASHNLADGNTVRRNQLRTLLSVDDAVQAIHDKLAALGQLDDTLVVYISDNGFTWGDHGLTGKAVPYGPAHEVPFYLSWPAAGLDRGTVDDRIVANIDVAPTLLDAAGVTPDTPQDGQSLFSELDRDHILTECWEEPSRWGPKHTWASYVSRTEQYVEYYDLRTDAVGEEVGSGQVTFREYYDLAADRYQLVNRLHLATLHDESGLKIPALAASLTADRKG